MHHDYQLYCIQWPWGIKLISQNCADCMLTMWHDMHSRMWPVSYRARTSIVMLYIYYERKSFRGKISWQTRQLWIENVYDEHLPINQLVPEFFFAILAKIYSTVCPTFGGHKWVMNQVGVENWTSALDVVMNLSGTTIQPFDCVRKLGVWLTMAL